MYRYAVWGVLLAGGTPGLGELERQPLSPLLLYSSVAMHIYRLMLWTSSLSFVGVYLRWLVRRRSSHYRLQPWRQGVDILLMLLFITIAALAFADRQLVYMLTLTSTLGRLPWFTPLDTSNEFYSQLISAYQSHRHGIFAAREILAVAASGLSMLPTSDEYFHRVPPYLYVHSARWSSRTTVTPSAADAAASGGRAHEFDLGLHAHPIRDGYAFLEGGVTYLIGFWSARAQMTEARPFERFSGGGPALAALPESYMRRGSYGWRVAAAMVFLMSDVSANLLVDTLHWDKVIMHDALGTYLADEQLFYDDKDQISELASIVLAVVTLGARVGFGSVLFLMVVTTKHFSMGRYSEIWVAFGGAGVTSILAFILVIIISTLRVSRHGSFDASYQLEISGIYWDDVFSTIYATNLVLTTIYYIKGVSALIRLSDSQYYTHPEDLRRRRHRQNHASSVQLAPI